MQILEEQLRQLQKKLKKVSRARSKPAPTSESPRKTPIIVEFTRQLSKTDSSSS